MAERRGTWIRTFKVLALAGAVLVGTACDPARAASPARTSGAAQLVGLFLQSCVRFLGNVRGLRQWADGTGLRVLPAPGQQAFLSGTPGEVFDATAQGHKLVLVSENGGSCSALAESAEGATVTSLLEQAMRGAHVDFAMTRDEDDREEKALHHREYAASQGAQRWTVLISTVKGETTGEVMLTARP